LEGLAGAYLINKYANGLNVFENGRDVFKFAALAAVFSTMVSATIGVTSLALLGYASWSQYGYIWLTWWLGDAAGNLVVAPAVILWGARRTIKWDRSVEAAILLVTLFALAHVVFRGYFPSGVKNYPLEFLCIPMVVWAAFRFSPRETATTTLMLSAIAIIGTLEGFGPFVRTSANDSLLLLQTFMGVVSVMGLALAAVVQQGRRMEQKLRLRVQESALTLENEILEHAQKKSELLHANAEREQLELFAFVAAHDFREPLKKILIFSDMLRQGLQGALSSKNNDYLERVREGATRLNELINDLSRFSRAVNNNELAESVDLNKIFEEVLKDLELVIEESRAQIEKDDLPVVYAGRVQMRDLFQNLIGNAVKFRKKDRPPLISIKSERDDHGNVLITVKDDGIGFSQKYADAIFKPFERLNMRGEYSGSGIGLTICQRIVKQLGGTISVQSAPEQGATFTIVLPGARVITATKSKSS
jgi:signal transduction histidine kinase